MSNAVADPFADETSVDASDVVIDFAMDVDEPDHDDAFHDAEHFAPSDSFDDTDIEAVDPDRVHQDFDESDAPSPSLDDLLYDSDHDHSADESQLLDAEQPNPVADSPDALLSEIESDLAMLASKAAAEDLTEEQYAIGIDFADTPAFQKELLERRLATLLPLTIKRPSQLERRQIDLSFGPLNAPAGWQAVITVRPQCLFRSEKMMATDTASTPGMGTSIIQVAVGNNIQRPSNAPRGSLTAFFTEQAKANGLTFDTAHPYEDIALTVSFITACTFYANLFGTAELE